MVPPDRASTDSVPMTPIPKYHPPSLDHPLRSVRRLTDLALDDLGGLVALTESADAEGLPRRTVRIVLLQALYGLHTDAETAEQIRADDDCRGFVGLDPDEAAPSAADCAVARRLVLGISGFGEFLGVLLELLERRGLLANARFAPDGRLLQAAPATGVMLAPGL